MSGRTIESLMSLAGRVAVITGGAGHVGRAIASAVCEGGARVALLDNDAERLAAAADELGSAASPYDVDLSSPDQLRQVADALLADQSQVDILIHCAALVGSSELDGLAVSFEEQRLEAWDAVLSVNLTAPFVLTQSLAPALRHSGRGVVLNIGSIYGVVGPDLSIYPEGSGIGNPAAYAASKGGLGQLTRWLATVLAPDVRVNMISLGGIARGQDEEFVRRYCARTPIGRMGTEQDVIGAAVFLVSDLSAYVTGQNLMVDGGWTTW